MGGRRQSIRDGLESERFCGIAIVARQLVVYLGWRAIIQSFTCDKVGHLCYPTQFDQLQVFNTILSEMQKASSTFSA